MSRILASVRFCKIIKIFVQISRSWAFKCGQSCSQEHVQNFVSLDVYKYMENAFVLRSIQILNSTTWIHFYLRWDPAKKMLNDSIILIRGKAHHSQRKFIERRLRIFDTHSFFYRPSIHPLPFFKYTVSSTPSRERWEKLILLFIRPYRIISSNSNGMPFPTLE